MHMESILVNTRWTRRSEFDISGVQRSERTTRRPPYDCGRDKNHKQGWGLLAIGVTHGVLMALYVFALADFTFPSWFVLQFSGGEDTGSEKVEEFWLEAEQEIQKPPDPHARTKAKAMSQFVIDRPPLSAIELSFTRASEVLRKAWPHRRRAHRSDGGSYSERGRSCSFTLKYFGYIYLIGCMCGVWKPGQRLGARSLMLSVLLYACQDKKMRNFTCDIPAIAAEDCPQFWRPQDVSDVSSGGFTRAKAQGRPSASDQAIKLINRLQTTEVREPKTFPDFITNNFNGGFKTDHIAFVSISAALDETSDAMLRDINLSQSHAATRTETYLAELLYKMETIKFATEWQKQTGPGALASKAKYNTELFQRENIAIFRDLSNWQKKTKWKSIPLNSATLKSLANNLLPLFGTGVLIHPFFATHNLGHKRAHHFKSLLDVFINLTPPAENSDVQGAKRFDDLEETNREVLYTLVSGAVFQR
ncbi:hypothetical protein B0H14DRAFT_3651153 [Mycena olivaceomarginata]|nr:hypothetical protein B0H14DRAFT_3651153 [Mycena olivaceomarginata]